MPAMKLKLLFCWQLASILTETQPSGHIRFSEQVNVTEMR